MKALHDVKWVTLSMGATRIVMFGTTVAVARVLPVEAFASYLVLIVIVTIAVPVADAGISSIVTREAAARTGSTGASGSSLLRKADQVRLGFWIASLVLSGAVALALDSPIAALLPFVLLAGIGQARTETLAGELVGEGRFAAGSLLRAAPALLNVLTLVIVLVFVGATLGTIIAAYAVSRLLPSFAGIGRYRRDPAGPMLSLRSGAPFAIANVLAGVYVGSDLIFLELFAVDALLIALYGVAYRIVAALQILPVAIATALFPRVVRAATPGEAQSLVSSALGLTACISFVLLAVALIGAKVVFSLFGPEYREGADTMLPLLCVLPAMAMAAVLISALQGSGREVVASKILFGAVCANIGGHILLIPLIGVSGAMAATTAAEFTVVWLSWRSLSHAHTPERLAPEIWVPLLVVSAAAFAGLPAVSLSGFMLFSAMFMLLRDSLDVRSSFVRMLPILRRRGVVSGSTEAEARETPD